MPVGEGRDRSYERHTRDGLAGLQAEPRMRSADAREAGAELGASPGVSRDPLSGGQRKLGARETGSRAGSVTKEG